MKGIILFFVLALVAGSLSAQTLEELKAQKAEKVAEVNAAKSEVDAIQKQIDALPGWRFGGQGIVGFNLRGVDNWFSQPIPNSNSGVINVNANGFANLIQDKYFWRNQANLALGWAKFDNTDLDDDNTDYQNTTDVLNVSSLFGYRINSKWAASALAEYRTPVINNFNNPGFLDIGVGATWTPIQDLVVVIHPLNYNFIFSDEGADFTSSLGCKVVADYSRSLPMGIAWRTNFSGFLSYDLGAEDPNLHNWTWTNGFTTNIWQGLGTTFEFALRSNEQEAFATGLDENKLQSYWTLGLSYTL